MTPALEKWIEEIVALDGSRVTVVEVAAETGARELAPPANPQQRAVLAPYFQNRDFAAQFALAQATSVNIRNGEQRISFVLLNPNQLSGDAEEREALIAHELGHLWLRAKAYPAAIYQQGPASCLYITAGDLVQHPLIRKEMTRRGVRWIGPWVRSLEAALRWMQNHSQADREPPTRCQELITVSLFVDVALNLTPDTWPEAGKYLQLTRDWHPEAAKVSDEILEYLRGKNLEDKAAHKKALEYCFGRLKAFALTVPP